MNSFRKKRKTKEKFICRSMKSDGVQKQFNIQQAEMREHLTAYYAESFMIFIWLAVGIVHLDNDAPITVVVFLACLWGYSFRITLNSWAKHRRGLDVFNDLPCVLFRIRG